MDNKSNTLYRACRDILFNYTFYHWPSAGFYSLIKKTLVMKKVNHGEFIPEMQELSMEEANR